MVEIRDVEEKIAGLDERLQTTPEGVHPFYYDQMKWLVELSARLMKHWQVAIQRSSNLQPPLEPQLLEPLADVIEETTSTYYELTDTAADEAIRRLSIAIRASADAYLANYTDVMHAVDPQVEHSMRTMSGLTRTIFDELAIVNETLKVKKDVEKLAEDTSAETEKVRSALGLKAELELADFFKTYARNELWLSWVFRVGTGAASAAVLYFAYFFYEHPPNADVKLSIYWSALGLRFVALAILGGIAVYLSKLASSHRRNGDWAKAMSVQLQTFSRFLEPLKNDEAIRNIYEEFARRVFGPPPTPAGDDAAVLPLTEAVSLINLASKG